MVVVLAVEEVVAMAADLEAGTAEEEKVAELVEATAAAAKAVELAAARAAAARVVVKVVVVMVEVMAVVTEVVVMAVATEAVVMEVVTADVEVILEVVEDSDGVDLVAAEMVEGLVVVLGVAAKVKVAEMGSRYHRPPGLYLR